MSQVRPSSSRGSRRAVVGATAALAVGLTATGALAVTAPQKAVSVSAQSLQGTRQFSVLDAAGANQLTALDLGSTGGGQPFQIKVVDDKYKAGTGFDVTGEMTNLYHSNDGTMAGIDRTSPIASKNLSVDYTRAPSLDSLGLGVLPKLSLSGLLPTCQQLKDLLPVGSALLKTATTTGSTTLGGLLGTSVTLPTGLLPTTTLDSLGLSDAAAPLCQVLGTTAQQVDGVLVTLQTKVLTPALNALPLGTTLPISLANGNEAGAFTSPSFAGIGADDPAAASAPAATTRMLLGGESTVLPVGGLDTLVSQLLGTVKLSSVTTPADLLAALQKATATTPLANVLGTLVPADLAGVLKSLDSLTATVTGSVLDTLSGTYRSYPQLKADLAGARPGSYFGTLTVTFVQDATN